MRGIVLEVSLNDEPPVRAGIEGVGDGVVVMMASVAGQEVGRPLGLTAGMAVTGGAEHSPHRVWLRSAVQSGDEIVKRIAEAEQPSAGERLLPDPESPASSPHGMEVAVNGRVVARHMVGEAGHVLVIWTRHASSYPTIDEGVELCVGSDLDLPLAVGDEVRIRMLALEAGAVTATPDS